MAMKFTEEQLNSFDKSMLIQLFLNQQEQLEKVSADLHSLDTKMQAMMEQLILANKNRFGRSSEKMEDAQQLRFAEVDGTIVFFNEAEAVCDLEAPVKRLGTADVPLPFSPALEFPLIPDDKKIYAAIKEML